VKPPAAGKGRPKGALNKTTRQAKECIALVAENLGGAERMEAWVRENPDHERVFWTQIYPKLVPLNVEGSHNVAMNQRSQDELEAYAQRQIEDIFGPAPLITEHN
jgi:hypothetical protein